jgi:hypothetical protein
MNYHDRRDAAETNKTGSRGQDCFEAGNRVEDGNKKQDCIEARPRGEDRDA